MTINNNLIPGTGFIFLLLTLLTLALLLSWTFKITRIEETIMLEELGMQQLYRHNYAQALEFFEKSALVDTDKGHHVLRYLDSFHLALQIKNIDQASFFFDEVSGEAPELLGRDEILGLLSLQPDTIAAAAFINKAILIESINPQAIGQAISMYTNTLDEQARSKFSGKLNQTITSGKGQVLQ